MWLEGLGVYACVVIFPLSKVLEFIEVYFNTEGSNID
jgi:hypothetical protein